VYCIYECERSLYIHPSECVDCGACATRVPGGAIYNSDDVQDEWADCVRANVEFFEALGSPQGACGLGEP
jgi:ferredoxin